MSVSSRSLRRTSVDDAGFPHNFCLVTVVSARVIKPFSYTLVEGRKSALLKLRPLTIWVALGLDRLGELRRVREDDAAAIVGPFAQSLVVGAFQ
jgi:hypothetical protein